MRYAQTPNQADFIASINFIDYRGFIDYQRRGRQILSAKIVRWAVIHARQLDWNHAQTLASLFSLAVYDLRAWIEEDARLGGPKTVGERPAADQAENSERAPCG
ncbi:MAG: hypothetical protein IT423_17480 [Pirellulaceae bacterium]|nr:hypothetical protein [Pirellulaceae bacterium]